jgi:hypothetical protein
MRKKTEALAPSIKGVAKPKPAVPSALGGPSFKDRIMSEETVRLCAYRKWETAGKPEGDGVNFWLEAERELSQAN